MKVKLRSWFDPHTFIRTRALYIVGLFLVTVGAFLYNPEYSFWSNFLLIILGLIFFFIALVYDIFHYKKLKQADKEFTGTSQYSNPD